MTYTILTYDRIDIDQKEIFFNFLQETKKETAQPAHRNMWDDDWVNNTNTLPYLLEKTDKFKIGGIYHIAFDNSKVVGCSGVYTSAFNTDLAIAGTRTWIAKDYRNLSIAREIFLPIAKDWALRNNFKAVGICFNEYNKNIIEIWNRLRLGEERSKRQPHHFCYNGVNKVPFPVTIQYTKQWIIYEKLHIDFNFNWDTIKWKQ
jgi:hypothetical protein